MRKRSTSVPRHIVFAHRERRQTGELVEWAGVFAENIGTPTCRHPDCGRRGSHAHFIEVSDMSATELLALSAEDFEEAFQDLRAFDPDTYCDIATARLELMCERAEDEGKAADDRGRRVA